MTTQMEAWESPQKVLVILAHPDDPEFFCGATLAYWATRGHEIHYYLMTCGEKGGSFETTPLELCTTRHKEQLNAAQVIGAKTVHFLDYKDGYLIPDLSLRKEIVRVIRIEKPDILVSCDPTNLYPSTGYGLNHPDHRAVGQAVLDAVFPASGNIHYFPELMEQEYLEPHTPREVWLSLPQVPNVVFDVTSYWDIKLRALLEHRSQIGNIDEFHYRMRARHTKDSSDENPRYEEKFRVIKFQQVMLYKKEE